MFILGKQDRFTVEHFFLISDYVSFALEKSVNKCAMFLNVSELLIE